MSKTRLQRLHTDRPLLAAPRPPLAKSPTLRLESPPSSAPKRSRNKLLEALEPEDYRGRTDVHAKNWQVEQRYQFCFYSKSNRSPTTKETPPLSSPQPVATRALSHTRRLVRVRTMRSPPTSPTKNDRESPSGGLAACLDQIITTAESTLTATKGLKRGCMAFEAYASKQLERVLRGRGSEYRYLSEG